MDTFDRGEAKYFHGRESILNNFTDILDYAKKKKQGTIFLAQGAPGAGKTALLYECIRRAEQIEWETVEIEPEHLWDPDRLRKELGMDPEKRGTSREHVAGITSHATATTQREITVDSSPAIPRDILESGKTPLLLILDEAQRLGETHPPPENLRGLVTSLLHGIHNGKLGRPLVFLTAGLGKTSRVFKSLGVSRFEGDALIEMGLIPQNPQVREQTVPRSVVFFDQPRQKPWTRFENPQTVEPPPTSTGAPPSWTVSRTGCGTTRKITKGPPSSCRARRGSANRPCWKNA